VSLSQALGRFFERRLMRMLHPPRRAIPTRAGLFALGAPIVLGVAAVNASNNLLFMLLGGALGAIVLSGVLSERNMRGVRAGVRSVSPVYKDEPARLLVTLSREDDPKETAYGLTIAERKGATMVGDIFLGRNRTGLLTVTVPVLEPGGTSKLGARTFGTRGKASIGRTELLTRFPFGLLIKSRDLDVDLEVIVRPKRIEVPEALADPRSLPSDGDIAEKKGIGLELYGLREKEERDAHQRIHALRSLSLGFDAVIETDGVERPMAWLGVANGEGADPEAFERALELAQAILVEWTERGYAVGLATFDEEHHPNLASLDAMLDHLALLAPAVRSTRQDPPLWIVPEGVSLDAAPNRHLVRVGKGV
jgi:uncharacterized protein (DUF58 family)